MAECGFSISISNAGFTQLIGLYNIAGQTPAWNSFLGGYTANENKMIVLKG